ncbi:MAG: ABC transporter substrate-binding protein [Gammaproteobacteria bacterium]|nr:ABC transporter substrate-binding protein [Gammaproteobacteria bacterium]
MGRGYIRRWAHVAVLGITLGAAPAGGAAGPGFPEKEDLKFGFIKLTDMAPLAIAYEKGYFEDEGLYVQLEAQANWKVLLDGVINGQLDGAHMLAGQPLAGTFEYEKGDRRAVPDFNVFFRHHATYPYYSDAMWYLTQMRRWGQIADAKSDDWYRDTAREVYRPDIYRRAAEALIADSLFTADEFPDFDAESGYRPPQSEFIDGVTFDGRAPNAYLEAFDFGLKGDDRL